MFMEFQIANAIHAERDAKRNHIIEGMTVQVPGLFERVMSALASARRGRTTTEPVSALRSLSQNNAIAK